MTSKRCIDVTEPLAAVRRRVIPDYIRGRNVSTYAAAQDRVRDLILAAYAETESALVATA